jgi:heme o synthase
LKTSVSSISVTKSVEIIKLKALGEMLKFRLSLLVLFSGAFGFFLANKGSIDYETLTFFLLGGFCITGAANILNQIFEKDLDALMQRTKDRPLPSNRLTISEATVFVFILLAIGFGLMLWKVNLLATVLTLTSLILYAFIYTPLKQITPFSVLVGAIPGALPPLIGWVACSGTVNTEASVIFGIQFIWQFPHFWAIAWVLDDDYKKAGFKMLPSKEGRSINTALQIMIYTLFLIPLGLLPTKFGIVGVNSAIIATVCGVMFLAQTFHLMKECTTKAARQIMFGSFLYLPIVQITFILDKM